LARQVFFYRYENKKLERTRHALIIRSRLLI
jgi:hypothetical protein